MTSCLTHQEFTSNHTRIRKQPQTYRFQKRMHNLSGGKHGPPTMPRMRTRWLLFRLPRQNGLMSVLSHPFSVVKTNKIKIKMEKKIANLPICEFWHLNCHRANPFSQTHTHTRRCPLWSLIVSMWTRTWASNSPSEWKMDSVIWPSSTPWRFNYLQWNCRGNVVRNLRCQGTVRIHANLLSRSTQSGTIWTTQNKEGVPNVPRHRQYCSWLHSCTQVRILSCTKKAPAISFCEKSFSTRASKSPRITLQHSKPRSTSARSRMNWTATLTELPAKNLLRRNTSMTNLSKNSSWGSVASTRKEMRCLLRLDWKRETGLLLWFIPSTFGRSIRVAASPGRFPAWWSQAWKRHPPRSISTWTNQKTLKMNDFLLKNKMYFF